MPLNRPTPCPKPRRAPFHTRALLSLLACGVVLSGAFSQTPMAVAQVFTEPAKPKPTAKPKPAAKPKAKPKAISKAKTPRPKKGKRGQPVTVLAQYATPEEACRAQPNSPFMPSSYTGDPHPQWIIDGALSLHPEAKSIAGDGRRVAWRCMGGTVHACYDRQDDHSPCMDAARKGRPTGQWVDISTFAPGFMVGAITRPMLGKWEIVGDEKGLFSNNFIVHVDIIGGDIGAVVGNVVYNQFEGRCTPIRTIFSCASELTLVAVDGNVITLTDRVVGSKALQCPGDQTLKLTWQGNAVTAAWIKPEKEKQPKMGKPAKMKKPKVTMEGIGARR